MSAKCLAQYPAHVKCSIIGNYFNYHIELFITSCSKLRYSIIPKYLVKVHYMKQPCVSDAFMNEGEELVSLLGEQGC